MFLSNQLGTCLQVTLKECDTFDLRVLKSPSDYMAAANSNEALEKMEACMKVWIKQIEQVILAGIHLIRR